MLTTSGGDLPHKEPPGEIPVPSFDTSDVFMSYLCLLCNQSRPMRPHRPGWKNDRGV